MIRVHGDVVTVNTHKELEKEKAVHDVLVVYFGETMIKQYTKIFYIIAKRFDKAFFLKVDEGSELEAYYGMHKKPAVLMLRRFEDSQEDHSVIRYEKGWDAKSLERWIVQKTLPDVFEFDQKHSFHVFVYKHPAVFLFRDPMNETHQELTDKFY